MSFEIIAITTIPVSCMLLSVLVFNLSLSFPIIPLACILVSIFCIVCSLSFIPIILPPSFIPTSVFIVQGSFAIQSASFELSNIAVSSFPDIFSSVLVVNFSLPFVITILLACILVSILCLVCSLSIFLIIRQSMLYTNLEMILILHFK